MEHYFFDFQYLILNEKFKKLTSIENKNKFMRAVSTYDFKDLDDYYIARLMVTSNDQNQEFYGKRAV